MKTSNYESAIKTLISKQVYYNTYNFFGDYEERNGQPKYDLIFLEYANFDNVIVYFFDKLVEHLRSSGLCNTIKAHLNFNLCVETFFIHTAISTGKLAKKIKDQFLALKTLNKDEFNDLINEIKRIKAFFVCKYIRLFNQIRDQYGVKLQQENEIHLCPYCERNYINVVQKNSLTIKPDLDHFYPKAKYPFLAATLDNLVPSCQVCNSRLKSEKDFYKIKHTHPLQSSADIFKKIDFDYLGKSIFIANKKAFNSDETKYLDTFRIEEVYGSHIEILDELLDKNKHYNTVKKNHILKTCPSLSEQAIKKVVFYEYLNLKNKKTPMCSLKKSLFEKIVK